MSGGARAKRATSVEIEEFTRLLGDLARPQMPLAPLTTYRVVGHAVGQHRARHHASVGDHADGVAVLGCLGHGVGADALAGAGLVLDDHGLAQDGAGLGGHQARIAVHDAWREGHDDCDGFVRVVGQGKATQSCC